MLFIGCIFFGGFGSSVLLPRIVKIFAESASADGSNLLNLIVICGMNKQACRRPRCAPPHVCVCARARVFRIASTARKSGRSLGVAHQRRAVSRPAAEAHGGKARWPLHGFRASCLAATHALL